MDAPQKAQFAASIAQGSGKAQGMVFAPVQLETRKKLSGVKYLNLKNVENNEDVEKNEGVENGEALDKGEAQTVELEPSNREDCQEDGNDSIDSDSEDDVPLILLNFCKSIILPDALQIPESISICFVR